MTTERVVVRMSRSDPSIPWAISFTNRGLDLVVAAVSPDGLSSKAGVQNNDTVIEMCGKKLNRDQAIRLMQEPRLDVDMVLTRLVTSHTCLPWHLSEKGNEVVVDHIDSRFRNNFNKDFGRSQITSAASNSSWTNPSLIQGNYSTRNETNNYAYSNTTSSHPHGGSLLSTAPFSSTPIPITHSHSGTNHSVHSNQSYVNHGTGSTGHHAGYSTGVNRAVSPYLNNYNAVPVKYTNNITPSTNGFNSGVSSAAHSPRTIPINQQPFIDTSYRGRESTLSPNRVAFHSPSSRTRRDLSPGAAIQHMQYNSPMNLYSTETAAEEFTNQTGVNPEVRLHSKSPAYLSSETRRLIEESERGAQRGASPHHQSPCFDRIAHAVGADY